MAQYTPSSGDTVRPHRSPWGNYPTRHFSLLSTAAALVKGTLMTLNIGGSSAVECAIPSTGAGGLGAFSIVGFAAQDSSAATSSAVAGDVIPVWEANPFSEFRAVTKGGAMASSNIGLRKALAYDSTLKITYVDLTASTATDWRVVVTQNLHALTGHSLGDSGCYVAFRFLTSLGEQIGSTTIQSSSPLLAFYS